jgi:hypothetical protein
MYRCLFSPASEKFQASEGEARIKEIATILNRRDFPSSNLRETPGNLFSGELFASFWLQKEVGYGAKPQSIAPGVWGGTPRI